MTEPNMVEQVVVPTVPGPVDPTIKTVLEGADDTVAPDAEQVAFGAAGDVPGLVATSQGLEDVAPVDVPLPATDAPPDAGQLDGLTKTELAERFGVRENQTKPEMIAEIVSAQQQPGVTHSVELQDTVGQQDLA